MKYNDWKGVEKRGSIAKKYLAGYIFLLLDLLGGSLFAQANL